VPAASAQLGRGRPPGLVAARHALSAARRLRHPAVSASASRSRRQGVVTIIHHQHYHQQQQQQQQRCR